MDNDAVILVRGRRFDGLRRRVRSSPETIQLLFSTSLLARRQSTSSVIVSHKCVAGSVLVPRDMHRPTYISLSYSKK